jgi:hypothetical protein
MNRNEQGTNEQNRTYRGRENLARRQAGPSVSGRSHHHHQHQHQHNDDRYDERHNDNNYRRTSAPEPEHLKSRERMRHDHDQNSAHDFHDRGKSYRAMRDEDEYRRSQYESTEDFGWGNNPGGELSWEEQYRTDGEEKNFHGKLAMNDFTGYGPRGYKRSDARIEDEVCELLARDHFIDASDIVVAVENGIVKLSGSVRQREDRVEAEMLAESVIGVEDIQNDISVQKGRQQH